MKKGINICFINTVCKRVILKLQDGYQRIVVMVSINLANLLIVIVQDQNIGRIKEVKSKIGSGNKKKISRNIEDKLVTLNILYNVSIKEVGDF